MTGPAMAWRPLRAWSADQCAGLAAQAVPVLQAWARGWGVPVAGWDDARARPATVGDIVAPQGDWTACRGRHGEKGWHRPDPEAPRRLELALFGACAGEGTLASQLVRAALDSAWQQLAAWTGLGGDAGGQLPGAADAGEWSGALVLELPVGQWLLSGEWAAQRLAAPAPSRAAAGLPSARAALAAQPLRLEARLQPTTLDLARLAGLRVGSILPLSHGLHEPLCLTDPQGRHCLSAWLVDLDGRRAVELAASPCPPPAADMSPEESPCTH